MRKLLELEYVYELKKQTNKKNPSEGLWDLNKLGPLKGFDCF